MVSSKGLLESYLSLKCSHGFPTLAAFLLLPLTGEPHERRVIRLTKFTKIYSGSSTVSCYGRSSEWEGVSALNGPSLVKDQMKTKALNECARLCVRIWGDNFVRISVALRRKQPCPGSSGRHEKRGPLKDSSGKRGRLMGLEGAKGHCQQWGGNVQRPKGRKGMEFHSQE